MMGLVGRHVHSSSDASLSAVKVATVTVVVDRIALH